MSSFFKEEDFSCLAEEHAKTTEPTIINRRKELLEYRFKALNAGIGSEIGLKNFLSSEELYTHCQKEHLTNVWYPLQKANGNRVDHLRMGYGKHQNIIKLLEEISGHTYDRRDTTLKNYGKFYCYTQLEVGIDENNWWVGLHLDKDGWIEQNNFMEKVDIGYYRQDFIEFLTEVIDDGFAYGFYAPTGCELPESDFIMYDAEECLDYMELLQEQKIAYSFWVRRYHDSYEENDTATILPYIREQFLQLLPLYKFFSWHPQKNNFLKK